MSFPGAQDTRGSDGGIRIKRGQKGSREGSSWGGGKKPRHKTPQLCSGSPDSLRMPSAPSCALLSLATVCPLGTQAPVPARMSRAVPGPLCTHWPALCLATANPKSLFAGYWVGRCWDSSLPPPQPPALIISGSKGSLWHKHRDTYTHTYFPEAPAPREEHPRATPTSHHAAASTAA